MNLLGADPAAQTSEGDIVAGSTLAYSQVSYKSVWPNTDVSYAASSTTPDQLEDTFTLSPGVGASPALIQIQFAGATSVKIAPSGDLLVTTASGKSITQSAPVAYEIDSSQVHQPVAVSYLSEGPDIVGFNVQSYGSNNILVIDPNFGTGPSAFVPGSQVATPNTPLTFSSGTSNAISVDDGGPADTPLTVGLSVSSGTLTLATTYNLTFTAGNGTSNQAMTFTGVYADVNAALNGLTYTTTGTIDDALAITVDDPDTLAAQSGQATGSVAIAVMQPSVAVPGSQIATPGGGTTFSAADGDANKVSDAGASSPTLTVALADSYGTLSLPTLYGLSILAGGNNSTSMKFSGSAGDINAALDGLTFTTASTTPDSINMAVDDQATLAFSANEATGSVAVTVMDPSVSVPGGQAVVRGASLAFTNASSNAITVGESAPSGTLETVSLSVATGTLTLASTGGLQVIAGGNGTSGMVFTGTLADANAALAGLTYAPSANADDVLTISIDDPATLAANHTNQATGSVSIAVMRPSVAGPGYLLALSGTAATLSSAGANAIVAGDSGPSSPAVTVTLSDSYGTLSLATPNGLAFLSGSDNSTSMQFLGTLSAVNAALDGLTFTGATSDTINVSVDDPATLFSGQNTATLSIAMDVMLPGLSVPPAQPAVLDGTLTFAGASSNAIAVSDSASYPFLIVQLSDSYGTLTLATTSGLSTISGNGSTSVTISGDAADVNAALNGLTYVTTTNIDDTIAVTVDDAASVALAAGQATGSVAVLVMQPSVSVPDIQAALVGSALTFSSAAGNAIAASDSGPSGPDLSVTLSDSYGALALAATSGLTFVAGSDNSPSMEFRGAASDVAAALNGLTFTTTTDANDLINVEVDDAGTLLSGQNAATASVAVLVSASGPLGPRVALPGPQADVFNSSISFGSLTSNAITVGDSAPSGTILTVQLSVGAGLLTLASTAGLTFTVGDGTNDAAMAFTGTAFYVNNALNGLLYRTTTNADDALTISVNDPVTLAAGTGQVTGSVGIALMEPGLTVPGAQLAIAGVPLAFSGAGANAIAASEAGPSGPDLIVTLADSYGTLTLARTTGLTFLSGSNNSTNMYFTGSAGDVDAALDGLTYTSSYGFGDTLNVFVNDAATLVNNAYAATGSVSIAVMQPWVSAPGAQAATLGAPLTFSSVGSNGIGVGDSGSLTYMPLTVSLSVAHGRLTLGGTAGLTFTTGDGSNDATMVFSGALVDVNNALNGLTYTTTTDSDDLLTIAADDPATLLYGQGQATASVGIAVMQPGLSIPAAQITMPNVAATFSAALGTAIAVSESGPSQPAVTVTLSDSYGTLALAGTTGLTFLAGSDNSTSMQFRGAAADVNTALDGLTFATASGGSDVINVRLDDPATLFSGQNFASASIPVTVMAPTLSVPAAQAAVFDLPLTFSASNSSAITVGDVGPSATLLTVTLGVSYGVLNLASTNGLTFPAGQNNSANMTIVGTAADIDAALNGMTYTATTDADDALQISVDDPATIAASHANQATGSVAIAVMQPYVTVPGGQQTTMYVPVTFAAAAGTAIVVGDIGPSQPDVSVSLSASYGYLVLGPTSGVNVLYNSPYYILISRPWPM